MNVICLIRDMVVVCFGIRHIRAIHANKELFGRRKLTGFNLKLPIQLVNRHHLLVNIVHEFHQVRQDLPSF